MTRQDEAVKLFELQSGEAMGPDWRLTVIKPIEADCIAARLQIEPEVAKHFYIEAIEIDRQQLLSPTGGSIPAMTFAPDSVLPPMQPFLLAAGQDFCVSVHNMSDRTLKFKAEVWGSRVASSSAAGDS